MTTTKTHDRFTDTELYYDLPYRDDPKDLQELTGHESGAILWPNGEIMVCNWAGTPGLPRIDPFGITTVGMGDNISNFKRCDPPANVIEAMIDHDIRVCDVPKDQQQKYREQYPDEFAAVRLPDHDVIVVWHLEWN